VHTGKIKKVISDRGFGFISDTDGREVFFHKGALVDVAFESLAPGQAVTFEVEQSEKGPRAVDMRLAQAGE
jgi:CspA family cold shock protein